MLIKMTKSKNKAINKRLVSCQHVVSSSLHVCLCSSQGHGLWHINRPQRLSELYMEGLVCLCLRLFECVRKRLQPRSWYVCLSSASRSLASSAQTAADPCGDSPASGCCRVSLKTPRHCLSDWPYGRQYHLGDPRCARHVSRGTGGKHGSLLQLFSFQ